MREARIDARAVRFNEVSRSGTGQDRDREGHGARQALPGDGPGLKGKPEMLQMLQMLQSALRLLGNLRNEWHLSARVSDGHEGGAHAGWRTMQVRDWAA